VKRPAPLEIDRQGGIYPYEMIKGGDEIRAHTLAERAVRGIETDSEDPG
jgi:hypothetical protein